MTTVKTNQISNKKEKVFCKNPLSVSLDSFGGWLWIVWIIKDINIFVYT